MFMVVYYHSKKKSRYSAIDGMAKNKQLAPKFTIRDSGVLYQYNYEKDPGADPSALGAFSFAGIVKLPFEKIYDNDRLKK